MQKSDHQCTVQAPHCANPQPKCMPCRPSWSRNAYSNGMLGSSTFKATALPLTVSLMVVAMTPVNPSLRSQGMCGETGGDCRQRLVEYCSYRYAISAIRGETSILHGTSFGGLPALRVPNLHSHFGWIRLSTRNPECSFNSGIFRSSTGKCPGKSRSETLREAVRTCDAEPCGRQVIRISTHLILSMFNLKR